MSRQPLVAFVVNHAAFFVSHRLVLALSARAAGFDVVLLTGQAGSCQMESAAVAQLAISGIEHKRTISRSSGTNPLIELMGLLQLIYFMIRFRPDVVHCASPKGVLYGGIAARICRVRGVVLAVSGLGYAFTEGTDQSIARKSLKEIYKVLARFAFRHPNVRVITQNKDDRAALVGNGLVADSGVTLIPGSGVDLALYVNCKSSVKKSVVLLPARMLKDKGVLEFVEAARQLRAVAPDWQFILAGAAGYDNPTAISEVDLHQWEAAGIVKWLGHVDNMLPLFQDASIVCLPSYREGMPKALLEAAAAGCAVVTTDVPGCREAIVSGVTGDLVPVRNSDALADTLLSLMNDVQRRKKYGEKGQERAKSLFSVDSVVSQTLRIYEGFISHEY
jgi:glycosyltransferase involved in cell wall biosynthesis